VLLAEVSLHDETYIFWFIPQRNPSEFNVPLF
jgi:hypothetical protein